MFRALIIFIVLGVINCAKYPSDLQKCKYGDMVCAIRVANEIMAKSAYGLPELGLPSTNPLVINRIGLNQEGDRPVVLNIEMKDCKMSGLPTTNFTTIQGFSDNIDKAKILLKYRQDYIQLFGPYKAKGKILVLPMNGDGEANITFTGVDSSIKMLTKKIVKNGKNYMQIDKLRLNFDVKRASLHFSNLFNGNAQLGDALNNFMNENWMDILNDLKPAMADSLGAVYKSLLNNMFSNIPYDEFFEK
ncbi:protein takeout-like [Chironomus tepperi]|uniref:protein takeout-like n=1 Tax=Chironomus tepperi TaxID=113505 RepID=UPI00391EE9A4